MADCFKQGSQDQANEHLKKVLDLWQLDFTNDQFDGDRPRLADALHAMCRMAQSANDAAEQEMDIENVMQGAVDDQDDGIKKTAKEPG